MIDPKGELGSYLKGVADASDVHSYVKEHSFGLPPITPIHSDWAYYYIIKRSLGKN